MSSSLVKGGVWTLVTAVVVSTALGYSGRDRLANVANGVLVLGLLLGIVLIVVGVVLRVVRGPRRRRR